MRPIPAPRIGESHGLLRAINQRERMRLDEFVTEFSAEDLYPPGLENALGRTRQFVSFARAAGLLKEDRGVVELTEIGKRYVRAGDDADAVLGLRRAGRLAAPPAAREAHDRQHLPRAGDRPEPAVVGGSRHADLHPGLRPRARVPRPRGVGQRGHAADPGRALPRPAHRPGRDRRPAQRDDDRRRDQDRAHAADPHVAHRHRRPAEPRWRRGGARRGRGRVGAPDGRAGPGGRARRDRRGRRRDGRVAGRQPRRAARTRAPRGAAAPASGAHRAAGARRGRAAATARRRVGDGRAVRDDERVLRGPAARVRPPPSRSRPPAPASRPGTRWRPIARRTRRP